MLSLRTVPVDIYKKLDSSRHMESWTLKGCT